MKLPEKTQKQLFDEKIIELHEQGLNYRQIANELNASYNVVKAIGEGLYGKYHYCSSCPKKGGAKKYDWEKIDSSTLPLVKDIICKLWGDGISRPKKITVGTVERYLHLPKNGLKHCPKCISEIMKYYETQEEYWTRELMWAVNTIIASGQELNWTRIKRMTEIRKENIAACMSYLEQFGDKQLVSQIKALFL